MDYINKVEIQGVIGQVTKSPLDSVPIYDISVLTSKSFGSKGATVIDNTWHHVKVSGDKVIGTLEKGKWVHAIGSLRNSKYIDSSGKERSYMYIIANKVSIL